MRLAASRFGGINRDAARSLLVLLALLMAWGAGTPAAVPMKAVATGKSDAALYWAIAGRVDRGESYYAAATAEQRARDYPLKPFVTVRPPALANIIAAFEPGGAAGLLLMLMAATLSGVVLTLRSTLGNLGFVAGTMIAAAAMATLAEPELVIWHEIWAGLLVALGLVARAKQRWAASIALIAAAALIRELALPVFGVMAFAAWREGERREAATWLAALSLLLLALAGHAALVAQYVLPTDQTSPGWSALGGWPFILTLAERSTLFGLLPHPMTAISLPLALLGWAGWNTETGFRGALYLGGLVLALTVLGRPDNIYWGAMLAPLLPLGLVFAPGAIADVIRRAR